MRHGSDDRLENRELFVDAKLTGRGLQGSVPLSFKSAMRALFISDIVDADGLEATNEPATKVEEKGQGIGTFFPLRDKMGECSALERIGQELWLHGLNQVVEGKFRRGDEKTSVSLIQRDQSTQLEVMEEKITRPGVAPRPVSGKGGGQIDGSDDASREFHGGRFRMTVRERPDSR